MESAKHTLFQNLNWLNRHLERILKNPRERPWETFATETQAKHTETETVREDFSKNKAGSSDMSNVIVVNDPQALLPPGVTWDDIDQFAPTPTADHNDGNDTSDVTTPMVKQEDQGESSSSSSAAAQPTEQQEQQPVIRKGIEVRLLEPRFENCTLIRVVAVDMQVECGRCNAFAFFDNMKLPDILSASGSSSSSSNNEANDKYERWIPCPTCSSLLGAKFMPGKDMMMMMIDVKTKQLY